MLDLTKPVQTRDGCKVRILCTDYKHSYPVVVIRTGCDGAESLAIHKLDGSYISNNVSSPNDLVNVPQRHKHADVIIAWANGAEIQYRENRCNSWESTTAPYWSERCEYRVKP